MRLIQTDGEGNIVGEVKTFDPIAGIHDAVRIAAQQGGDGVYWADTGDGKYFEFNVQNGQAHGLTEEGWRSGVPGEILDNSDMAERISRPASEFGGFFHDPDAQVETPAVNFLMPDTTAAVAAREASEAEARAAAEAAAAEAPAEEAPAEEESPVEETVEAPEGEEAEEGDEGEDPDAPKAAKGGDAAEAAPAE